MNRYYETRIRHAKRITIAVAALSVWAITSALLDRYVGISAGFSADALDEAVIVLAGTLLTYFFVRTIIKVTAAFFPR